VRLFEPCKLQGLSNLKMAWITCSLCRWQWRQHAPLLTLGFARRRAAMARLLSVAPIALTGGSRLEAVTRTNMGRATALANYYPMVPLMAMA
jgi:hypothetical protein